MAKIRGRLRYFFQCFGSKKRSVRTVKREERSITQLDRTSGYNELRVRFLPPDMDAHNPLSPTSPLSAKSDKMSVCSGTSKSSIYLDALEDHPDYDSDLNSLDDSISSYSLQIDGQYFFSARDDASTLHAFESITSTPI